MEIARYKSQKPKEVLEEERTPKKAARRNPQVNPPPCGPPQCGSSDENPPQCGPPQCGPPQCGLPQCRTI